MKKYSQTQTTILALALSAFFIFIFIPSIPLLFFEELDKNFNLPKVLTSPLNVYLGSLFVIFGLALFIWTVWLFLKIGKGTQTPLVPTQRLVTIGPFAYSRNPMVTGVILWILGLGFIFNSLSFIIIGFATPVLYLIYIKLIEEKELKARFGKEYDEYKKKVPFLIPRIHGRF